jgi:hypothetical protein
MAWATFSQTHLVTLAAVFHIVFSTSTPGVNVMIIYSAIFTNVRQKIAFSFKTNVLINVFSAISPILGHKIGVKANATSFFFCQDGCNSESK